MPVDYWRNRISRLVKIKDPSSNRPPWVPCFPGLGSGVDLSPPTSHPVPRLVQSSSSFFPLIRTTSI